MVMAHEHDHREFQPDTEGPDLTETQLREIAIRELLIEKGVLTADQIRVQVEAWEQKTPALGGEIVARAWEEPEFKKKLLEDGTAVVAEYDVAMADLDLKVIENTPEVHNVVVCTLCSCYPRVVLGLPPAWYKSFNYRRRVVREPRTVLAEFGTALSDDVEVRVHDSTADLRFLVLPMRPAGTDGMSQEELAGLVTRDSMIGVSLPKNPS
jgi:nitrile hydratase alpha subunit